MEYVLKQGLNQCLYFFKGTKEDWNFFMSLLIVKEAYSTTVSGKLILQGEKEIIETVPF